MLICSLALVCALLQQGTAFVNPSIATIKSASSARRALLLQATKSSNSTTSSSISDLTNIKPSSMTDVEEAAAAMTNFMAKAHEEKIAAMARVETKYKEQIATLQARVEELEGMAKRTTQTSGNSFAFPATNKELTEKMEAYRTFLSDYIVKSQIEKAKAVKTAEDNLTAKYEAIIEDLKAKKPIE